MINGTFKASRELDLTEKEAKAVADKYLDFYSQFIKFIERRIELQWNVYGQRTI
ncbi:hypothetical protein [Clostridium tagluense]|uniref:hypothetical protein n=1 Tax=Clostridium tagluense TaxID=360422 RepID=UPI0027153E0F|nr:hypothetical protein [Clostridium tagluense]